MLVSIFSSTVFAGNNYIVAISPNISSNSSAEFHQYFIGFLSSLKDEDSVEIYNAITLKKIDAIEIPKKFTSSRRGKERFFRRKLSSYANFLAKNKATSNNQHRINFIDLVDLLSEKANIDELENYSLIIYGSNTFISREIRTTKDAVTLFSNYSINNKAIRTTQQKNIYYFYTNKNNIRSSLPLKYIHYNTCQRSAELGIYSSNLEMIKSVTKIRNKTGKYSCKIFSKKKKKRKIVSIIKEEKGDNLDEIFNTPIITNPSAPTAKHGRIKVGLRWNYDDCTGGERNCDLDLHIKPHKFSSEIYYKNKDSVAYGSLQKVNANNKKNSYEIVDLAKSSIKIDDLLIDINFYEGHAPKGIDLELRVVFNDKIFYKNFHISATNGDRGKSSRKNSKNWLRVNLADVFSSSKDRLTKQ